MSSRPAWAAVLPSAPKDYDQQWMARMTDVINKLIEQLVEPRQLTAAVAVFSDLPHETPRYNTEGEVYTKVCANCAATVLCIHQTIAEEEQHNVRRKIRARVVAPAVSDRDDSGPPAGPVTLES
jgi:hypothetical protein